ncbi:hypothetical protein BFP97_14045 [Roseivirga sp. 4D4]|uniref:T9SS type A sorting domain-containing protein n=1 Tax=Roseivirga sp. 4D4 TaxID=1889784 RepID=UPI000852A61E|nr:T9SS type A sorting domain-containing protein [Roseivirga sp. 4D4]OEK02575.1 hypothetical protein BFP97_14045 [Roseivirga sp. 4D4]
MRPQRICLLAGIFLLTILATELKAQNPLTDIRFTWVDVNNSANDYTATSSPSSGGNIDDNVSYDIFFSRNTTTENNRRVSGYTLGGVDYDFLLDPDTLALRRVGSASRLSLWIEADGAVDNTADEIYLAPERQVPERSLYQANLLNIGYDNVLLNSGTNASNIERIDAIYRTGMATSTPANAAIPVMDRGANGEFKIAMILSLDSNGDPATYGNLVTVNTGDFGSGVVDLGLSVLFLQQALGEDPIPTGTSTQALGGTGITFAELGITANQIVYGYSLFGVDVNTTDHDLTDISTFPTDSNNSGLDMAAGAVSAVSSDGNLVKTTGPGGYKAALNTWLKANEGVTTATDASTVTDWQDQSLGDHDATTLINAPTYRDGSASEAEAINFNPTVDFIDASETGLQIANNSDFNVGGAPYTTKAFNIAIRTGNNVTTKQQLYEQGDDDRGIDMYIESGNLVVTAYNQIDDSGSGVSSPWNTGTPTTISTSVSTETEYIITFELNGSASGTGTVTAYLNGQSFGSLSSVGQLADHSDQIGLGDFNSQVVTPATCPVSSVVSSTGVTNPNNIIGAADAAYAEVNTNGNIITVDFGAEYPAGTQYSITWIRRPSSTGTAQMVLRESTSSGSGFVDHPSAPTVSVATPQTDVITANTAFRYIQITKTDPPSSVDFHLDAIVVDCSTSVFDQGDAASFYGSIPEFIYCSEPGSFSTAGRNKIESYLAIKYGITLDQSTAINYVNSNGDIIFNTATNASIGGYLEYNNDIAGIGRDDNSELDQSKSKSENTDAVVTIDRGTTISVDDTWLIWGNDNGALTESGVLTKPDTIDRRLERVWRVAERNEVLTTSVSFDITGLGLSTNESDYSLLIAGNSSNADFSNATVLTGGTLVGNVITFTGVDLENGQYFTLGTDFRVCSPGGIETNLALWLQATDKVYNTGTTLATDGQTVSGWGDSSTEGNDAADPSNLTTFETNTVNFNPAISFDNDATSLEGSLTTTNAGLTIFTAGFINSTSGGDDALLELRGGTADDRSFFINSRYAGNTAYASNLNEDTWNIWSIDHPSGNTANIFQNGASFESSYNATLSDAGIGTYNYTLGDDDTGGNDFVGFLGEVIVYEGTLSATDRQKVQSYLAIKYGVTIDQSSATNYLASDGGTAWDATANATYNNDIAGIGRDDMSCLEQKQSISQNSDALVTMGLGTIEADNASNTNNFSADDSFLMWGNDDTNPNQANALSNVSLLPGNVTERMQRVWKVDETGTVGATTIEFDLTGLGYSSNVSDFQLIISDTNVGGDFSGATTIPAASLVGDKLTFTNVNLTDGQFFTLGTARTQCGPGGITSDLYVWLRADAGTSTTTDNTTLSTWSDQSGTSTNAAADGNAPLFKNNATDNINFNPTIDFDGVDDRLSLGNLANIKSGATNGGDYTLLATGIRQSGTGVQYVLGSDGGTANEDLHFGFRSSTQATIAHWGNDLDATISAFDSPQAPYIVFSEYDGSGRIIEELRAGAIGRNTDANSTDLSGTKTNYVGDLASVGNYNGLISEVIVFDNDITDIQKQQVYTYMALKYGVTLTNNNDNDGNLGEVISGSVTEGDYVTSDGTTIVWDYSNNTTYHNDVAGIGRDDNSCWQQKQSRAEDTDDILTIGLGSIANSNGENGNIFADDHDYLVWGNDNGATADASVNTSDVPETIAERMARVWKVQDTGTVGETELQFDLTGLGYDVSDPNAFSLLVGNTATMADAEIITGGTLNGNILSFTGVNLTDGQFFTIGTQNVTCGPGGVNTDIALWLRADLGTNTTVDNENITTWTDQSSPANSATEQNAGGGSPVEPTYQANEMNFNPAIRFSDAQSNNNSWLETGSNLSDNDLTLISVFKTAQTNGSGTDFTESPALISNEATSGSDDYALGLAEGRLFINAENNNGYSIRPATTYVDEVTRIATATRVDANQANGINLYVNSENVGSATSDDVNLDAGGTFTIGNHSDYDADGQFEGDIAEILVFNKVLTAVERAKVESYLAIKYGITRTVGGLTESDEDYLAADGGIIWDIDNQGAYHNDILGIGRDDLSCFEQLKSKSLNSDAIVTFELDSTAFKDNDTFILSGNDNAPMEAIDNTERPVGINSRLNREWRVQETGTVDTVLLTYDLSGITGTPIGDNNLNLVRLMVDDDGDFSSGATLISPSSIDGRTVTFEVDFTDGQFYTLGSIETDALPITLISFTADHYNEDEVKLEWVTASEINNEFYTIERSRDGQSFEAIGIIDGAGNSDQLLTYSFIDRNPLIGLSFYRLKQTDFSGEFDHSEIKSIRVESSFETEFKAYPNPIVRGQTLKIKYKIDGDQKLKIMIFDPRGQFLGQQERAASISGELEISTSKFQKGLNLIRILDENQRVVTLKVLVR